MTNKFTSPPPDQLINSKLRVLLDAVNDAYQQDGVVLDDELLDLYDEAIQLFIDSIDGSITGVTYPIIPGAPSDPVDYNVFTEAISRDLRAMFYEVGSVDRLVGTNFNTAVALREQILAIARRVSLKTADYLLYSDPSLGNGFFFGDSFNSSTYVDVGSDLADTEECLLAQDEGIVALPLDGAPERLNISKFIINDSSNGTVGNNQQLNVLPHDDMNALGDGEPDTWVEYERVTTSVASSPLVLDLVVVLDEPAIVNHIHINPVFFGTPTPVKITVMETSLDGKEYLSVKDEVPIADFLSEEEDDVFVLSGRSSKYYGEAKFSFLPRRTKFVHLVLEQHSPYSIDTNNGTRLRYAIGLRDLNIYSRRFKKEGTLVSTPVSVGGDATKIAMWASENPTDQSTLAEVKHEVSVDDGASWLSIQPQGRDEVLYPEVVNVNNAESDSVQTGGEVLSVRHKIIMSRDPDAFSGDVTLKSEKLSAVDISPIPGFSPFTVELQQAPIAETVNVYLPTLGSLSCPRANRGDVTSLSPPMDLDFVEFRIENSSTGTARFPLPWHNVKYLTEKIRVFVNGEQWEYRSQTSADLALLDDEDRVYFLNKGGREIQFGVISGSTQYGMLPGAGSKVQVCLDGDNPAMTRTDAGFTLNLLGESDGIKDNMSIATPSGLATEDGDSVNGEWDEVDIPPAVKTFNLNKSEGETHKPVGAGSQEEKTDNVVKSSFFVTVPDAVVQQAGTLRAVPSLLEDTTDKDVPVAAAESLGVIPPVFDPVYNTGFQLLEYEPNSTELMPTSDLYRSFHNNENGVYVDEFGASLPVDTGCQPDGYVPFVDGQSEFYEGAPGDPSSTYRKNRWTFDAETGILYFANSVYMRDSHRVVFRFKRRKFETLDSSDWDYYKNSITGKIDTSRVVLKPSAVRQFPVAIEVDADVSSAKLVGGSDSNVDETIHIQLDKSYSWWRQKIVKGSVKLDTVGLIAEAVQPIEVPFVDGKSELQNAVSAKYLVSSDSIATTSIRTFTIPGIDADHPLLEDVVFDPVITYPDPIQASQFVTRVHTALTVASSVGEYYIDDATGAVQVMINGPLITHTAMYKYEDLTSGIDKRGLYSVDYEEGIIYFGVPVVGGSVSFNVTMYSCFYNMGEIVSDGNIKEINEAGQTVEMRPEYGIRFLADSTSGKPVPRYVRIAYDYYNKTTESLKDLEPFFSPVCKDVALRVVTKDMIGDF